MLDMRLFYYYLCNSLSPVQESLHARRKQTTADYILRN